MTLRPKVTGLTVTADVLRLQADNASMQGVRLFRSQQRLHSRQDADERSPTSSSTCPPEPRSNNCRLALPTAAHRCGSRAPIRKGIATPLTFPPSRRNAVRVGIHAALHRRNQARSQPLYPAAHLVIVFPKTMQFAAATPSTYQSMQIQSRRQQRGSSPADQARRAARFHVEGHRSHQRVSRRHRLGRGAATGSAPQGRDSRPAENRPGGGLGVPIDAPDPLQQYRWYILAHSP